jgi:hypothetical protein
VVLPDLARERRFKVARFVTDHGVKALVNVTVRGADSKPPFGILEVDSRRPRRFTQTDIEFLRTYANLLADAVERSRMLHELRSAVADKERLLREVQHRVKNNLQMIVSFIRLQERRIRNRDAQREFRVVQQRIETLSLVYDKLYAAGEVDRVDLGTYLGELGASLLRLHVEEAPGVHLRTDIVSLTVPLDQAVPLGLIVNEFVTNSFKQRLHGRARRHRPGAGAVRRGQGPPAALGRWPGPAAGSRGRHGAGADRGPRPAGRRRRRLGGRRRHAADGGVRPVNRLSV